MNKLKQARESAGFSQSQLSEKSGIKYRTLQEYEQGRKDINGMHAITLYRLARALDVPMESLLTVDEVVGTSAG